MTLQLLGCNAFNAKAHPQRSNNRMFFDSPTQDLSRPFVKATSLIPMKGFLDKLQEAFSNDASISPDKSVGQLEGPGQAETSSDPVQRERLEKWLQATNRPKTSTVKGNAPISESLLIGTNWSIELYLAGIPDRDPSNDLYGSRTNISNRDRTLGVGVTLPEEPSVTLEITLASDGKCFVESTDFTSGDGEWMIQPNGNQIRFSMETSGYQRTVQTTGSITKVFWSEEEDVTSKTQSTYSIPPGFMYADTVVGYGLPGQYVMEKDGILRVEQKVGVFGVTSKMIPCGKFVATMVPPSDSDNSGGGLL